MGDIPLSNPSGSAPSATLRDMNGKLDPAQPNVGKREIRRAERDQMRRQRLIDTALDLFVSRGYQRTPIELLCKESGVTTRHFYEYFGSREALMRAVYDHVMEGVWTRVMQSISTLPPENYRDRLFTGLETFLHAYLDDPRHAELICIQAVGVSSEMEAWRRKSLYLFADLLDTQAAHIAANVSFGQPLGRDLALALVGGTNELVIDWLQRTPRPPVQKAVDEVKRFYDFVVAGLEHRRQEDMNLQSQ